MLLLLMLPFSRTYDFTHFFFFSKLPPSTLVFWGNPPLFRLIGCLSVSSQHQESTSVLPFNNSVGKEMIRINFGKLKALRNHTKFL